MNLKQIALIACAALLVGCATVTPLNTSSGKPELTVRGKTMDEVQAALVQMCQEEDMFLEETQKFMVACSYASSNLGIELVLGSNYNAKPQVLIRFNTLPQPDKSIRITAKGVASQTTPMSGTRRLELDGNYNHIIQGFLVKTGTILGVQ